ncbi:MAG TPA: queuosine precursor transporter [Polyangiaceae bacterium]|nr:queuosine precursor transporter [Polyangiaceae bacterium]
MQRSSARGYKFYDILLSASVAVLLCSNLIGPGKTVAVHLPGLGSVSFGAGNIFFPISYIFGDVFTEVYGYSRARKAIWLGFSTMTFAALMSAVVIHLPADPDEPFNRTLQPAIEIVFGNTWRITVASLTAYWAGDFVNSFVLARMKLLTDGRHLWTRTVGSTIAGQLVDSCIFYPLSFFGLWKGSTIVAIVLHNWLFKVFVEVALTPVTYFVVRRLKQAEGEDYFDRGTNFNPFATDP